MNLLKYALKNLKIHRNRTIIMVITMVLVVTASVVGFSIQNATQKVSKEYKKEIGAKANIEVDYEKMASGGYAPKTITAKQYDKISKLDNVKSYSYLTELMLGSKKLKAVGEDEQEEEDKMAIVGEDGKQMESPTLKLIGGGGNADLPEFQKGSRKLTKGKAPKKDGEAIMSKELASLNHLKVGDKFKLSDIEGGIEKEFKLSGIFQDLTKEDGGSGVDMPIFNRRNEIITTFSSAMSMDKQGFSQVRATYQLTSPEAFDTFKKQVRDLGVSDDYKISIDKNSYDKAVGPINNLNSTMKYFIIIILIIAAGVLTLLSLLSARERQYEIGVLRAMGMKKNKIQMNFILESLITLILALVIGVGIGATLAKPMANSLLSNEIKAVEQAKQDQNSENQAAIFAPDSSQDVKAVDTINVTVDYLVLLEIAAIGVLIVIISNLFNLIFIMKFEPMEIMRSKK